MHTETIAGLHKCQPKNEPKQGEVKNMVVLNMPAKNGKKAWISIKNKKPEDGGSPYRILNVEKLDWPPDHYGNIALNLEVEASNESAFQQARSAMKEPESYPGDGIYDKTPPQTNVKPPVARCNGGDGVTETRKHLMKSANLLVLCIRATEKAVAPHQPVVAQTSEQFQSDVAKLFIEASSRRTTDGVNWWSYIDRMPDTPLAPSQSQQGKSGLTAPLLTKNACTCENTDGDNPLCPIHS